MTNEDVIINIDRLKELHKKVYGIDERVNKAVDIVKEALEKQIPKKPISKLIVGCNILRTYEIFVCPICGVDTPDPRDLSAWESWCPDCGQAIDWSEV